MESRESHADLISQRIAGIKSRIDCAAMRAQRAPGSVRLVAVTKTFDATFVKAAHVAGQRLFGENYLQEALEKQAVLAAEDGFIGIQPEFHFIGRIQSNKVPDMVGRFSLIHSVDRLKIADSIDHQAFKQGIIQPVLLQVNVSGEPSKGGVAPSELKELFLRCREMKSLEVRGLMTLHSFSADAARKRAEFALLRGLRDEVSGGANRSFELSMGMSDDFEIAIEEGATLVRVGTAIFGSRVRG